jgi:hypothetical protein
VSFAQEQVQEVKYFQRINRENPNIIKHHTNWRLKAISQIENQDSENLHFSGVYSLSKNDIEKIKKELLTSLESFQKIIKHSQEEELSALTIDWFKL